MPQRILTRNLIIHEDLALGQGTTNQTRGELTITGQQIELSFIFRTLDEIRALDYTRYTRVSIHADNLPVTEYWFDVTSASADNGDTILEPVPSIPLGRWLKVQDPPSYTTAELEDVTDPANTSVFKKAGAMVWNSTTTKPVWAVGSADADVWKDATGATAHTPV